MKKYECLTDDYISFKKGNIYSEDQIAKNNLTVKELVKDYPEEWELVEDEFVLPKRWCVRVTYDNWETIDKWKKTNGEGVTSILWDFVDYEGIGSIGITPDMTAITFDQFKEYILNQNDMKEIIGYRFRDEFRQFEDAAAVIGVKGLINKFTNCDNYNNYTLLVKHFSGTIKNLKEANVLDLWFEPVYEPKYTLPKINGYEGSFDHYGILTYGCAKIHIEELRLILRYNSIGANKSDATPYRLIKSITLSSDVTITMDEIKQIIEYFDNM